MSTKPPRSRHRLGPPPTLGPESCSAKPVANSISHLKDPIYSKAPVDSFNGPPDEPGRGRGPKLGLEFVPRTEMAWLGAPAGDPSWAPPDRARPAGTPRAGPCLAGRIGSPCRAHGCPLVCHSAAHLVVEITSGPPGWLNSGCRVLCGQKIKRPQAEWMPSRADAIFVVTRE